MGEQPTGDGWKHIWGKRKRKRGRRAGRREQKKKIPVGAGIFNISGQELDKEELKVLDRGLKYAPVKNLNKFDTFIQIHKYIRTLNQKKYFLSKPDTRPAITEHDHHSSLKNRSVFNPNNSDNKYVEVFKSMVLEDIDKLKYRKQNNPDWIRKGIESIENKKNVIIRPADKGGGLVVMSKEYYINDINTQLSDRDTYRTLPKDPLSEYKKELEKLISKGEEEEILSKKKRSVISKSSGV